MVKCADRYLFGAFHHMRVGYHIAFVVVEKAGAQSDAALNRDYLLLAIFNDLFACLLHLGIGSCLRCLCFCFLRCDDSQSGPTLQLLLRVLMYPEHASCSGTNNDGTRYDRTPCSFGHSNLSSYSRYHVAFTTETCASSYTP
ncbi:hypothetical protein D3C76_1486160 [compost metagenome]